MARIAIAGAGIAGLSCALLLARAGHQVTVVERDAPAPPADPDAMWGGWQRPGTPQARLGHTFLPGFHRLLADRLPDVLEQVLAAGAPTADYAEDVPGERIAEDAQLVAILCRRPVMEGFLRRAAQAEPGITIVAGSAVHGLIAEPRAGVPVVRGLLTDAGAVPADQVVVAAGRRGPVRRWIEDAGGRLPGEESSGCGFFCFTRYFRIDRRPDEDERVSAQLLTVADTGFMGYEMVGADAATFCIELEPAVGDEPLRELRRERPFMAVARALPGAAQWLDRSRPIGDVAVMGNEQNLVRTFVDVEVDRPAVLGALVIGDARARTNSVNAWGAGMALQGAVAAADAIDAHDGDLLSQALEVEDVLGAECRDRAELATLRDALLHREYAGQEQRALGSQAALVEREVVPAASADAEVFRAVTRAENQLDSLHSLWGSAALIERARQLPRTPAERTGPDRATVEAAIASA